MEAAFDPVAHQYDETFTFTKVGEKQRERVWDLLAQNNLLNKQLNILEVNCGTGEDAIRFAQAGNSVLATDISGEMIEVCLRKAENTALLTNIEFKQMGFHQISMLRNKEKFDLIFSNFGGLNCISPVELSKFMQEVSTLLKSGGSFVAVIMPPFCLWETFYFLLKGSFQKAFRRFPKKTEVVIEKYGFPVYYYNPYTLYRMNTKYFEWVKLAPIGLFLPPSYLEGFFSKRQNLLHWLHKIEKVGAQIPALGCVSDHYYIQLKKR